MDGPQLENGYTKVANEILEEMVKFKFNASQLKILMVLWRSTYGFNKKSHPLSLNFLAEAIGTKKTVIKKEIDYLISQNVIFVIEDAGFNKPREISFNKNYKQWSIPVGIQCFNWGTVHQEGDSQYTCRSTTEYTNRSTKKEIYKEIIKKEDYKSVYDFYLSLNLIKHRAYTEDMSKAIKKAIKNNKYDIEYCKTLLKRHESVVELTKDTPYPVKARGLAEFFGQKVFNAAHLICSEYDEGGKYYEQYLKEDKLKKENKPLKLIIRDDY